MLSGGDLINVRTTPLENTTIKTGGRKRNLNQSKMAKRPANSQMQKYLHRNVKHGNSVKRGDSDKRRRSSLLRRLSSKRASADVHQLAPHSPGLPPTTPPTSPLSGHHSKLSSRVLSKNSESTPIPCPKTSRSGSVSSSGLLHSIPADPNVSPGNFETVSIVGSPSSSSTSSRPSSLDGLKFKLKQTFRSPRRKSCGHIPLSPLARANGSSSPPVSAILNPAGCGNTQGIAPHLLSSTSPTSRSPSPLAILSTSSNGATLQHSASSPLASKSIQTCFPPSSSGGSNGGLSGSGNHRLAPIGGFARKRLNSHPNRPQSVIVESGDNFAMFNHESEKNFSLSKCKREFLSPLIREIKTLPETFLNTSISSVEHSQDGGASNTSACNDGDIEDSLQASLIRPMIKVNLSSSNADPNKPKSWIVVQECSRSDELTGPTTMSNAVNSSHAHSSDLKALSSSFTGRNNTGGGGGGSSGGGGDSPTTKSFRIVSRSCSDPKEKTSSIMEHDEHPHSLPPS